jgi:hypothetical protein
MEKTAGTFQCIGAGVRVRSNGIKDLNALKRFHQSGLIPRTPLGCGRRPADVSRMKIASVVFATQALTRRREALFRQGYFEIYRFSWKNTGHVWKRDSISAEILRDHASFLPMWESYLPAVVNENLREADLNVSIQW